MIDKLLAEIEYYENRGFHKTADKLEKKLRDKLNNKVAREFLTDVNQDFRGLKGIYNTLTSQLYMQALSKCKSMPGFSRMDQDVFDKIVQMGTNTKNFDATMKALAKEMGVSSEDLLSAGDDCTRTLANGIRAQIDQSSPSQPNQNNQPTI